MGTFWSYFLEFFGLSGLGTGAAQRSVAQVVPVLLPDHRSESERSSR